MSRETSACSSNMSQAYSDILNHAYNVQEHTAPATKRHGNAADNSVPAAVGTSRVQRSQSQTTPATLHSAQYGAYAVSSAYVHRNHSMKSTKATADVCNGRRRVTDSGSDGSRPPLEIGAPERRRQTGCAHRHPQSGNRVESLGNLDQSNISATYTPADDSSHCGKNTLFTCSDSSSTPDFLYYNGRQQEHNANASSHPFKSNPTINHPNAITRGNLTPEHSTTLFGESVNTTNQDNSNTIASSSAASSFKHFTPHRSALHQPLSSKAIQSPSSVLKSSSIAHRRRHESSTASSCSSLSSFYSAITSDQQGSVERNSRFSPIVDRTSNLQDVKPRTTCVRGYRGSTSDESTTSSDIYVSV